MRLRATILSSESSSRPSALLAFAATVAIFAGCVTKSQAHRAPLPREDLAEYRQIAVNAQKAVAAMLRSLDRTVATTPCPPGVFKSFGKDVQRLEVDSFKVRARAQAIRTRGKAYFDQWQEHLASVKDPQARQLAEQRRDRLQERFARIHLLTQDAREAFQPFMTGLRRIRNSLEKDPAAAGTSSTKELIQTTRDNGRKVEENLAAILGELDAVTVILKPDKNANKN